MWCILPSQLRTQETSHVQNNMTKYVSHSLGHEGPFFLLITEFQGFVLLVTCTKEKRKHLLKLPEATVSAQAKPPPQERRPLRGPLTKVKLQASPSPPQALSMVLRH